ncbi:hypothetical protein PMAC_001771 [Pneumocystis sp. 'macacae']|nr:hypothetical protein PMAC_001771 [Pneumocystis sp. 'macacae']
MHVWVYLRFGKSAGKRGICRYRRIVSFETIENTDIGTQVQLSGWFVPYQRKLSHRIQFYGLRDINGRTIQLVLRDASEKLVKEVQGIPAESVIEVDAVVRLRPEKDRHEGEVMEFDVEKIRVVNAAKTVAFLPAFAMSVNATVRAKYRYLDLRNPLNHSALRLRSNVAKQIRDFFHERGFLEIDTPLLFKSTPEGAREFIVPTRQYGYAYALPQSPQQYKQILMASGIGKYYQLAKCFRDEDLRKDRQPEFTQLDLEMSFVTQEDIYMIVENLLSDLWKMHLGIDLVLPFKKMTYRTAISKYGSDKPDLRYGLEIYDISSFIAPISLEYPITEAIVVKNGSVISTNRLQAICKKTSTPYQSVIAINLCSFEKLENWISKTPFTLASDMFNVKYLNSYLKLEVNDVVFLSSRSSKYLGNTTQLGIVRQLLHHECVNHKLMPSLSEKHFEFVWINEFPLFTYEKDESKQSETFILKSTHHPFTSPLDDDIHLLQKNPESVRANHYDIVVNGMEIGGGSIRIHDVLLQRDILQNILKIPQYKINQFSHLFEILSSGCPPHGGIALGFDRLVAILFGTNSIRDVIAFPKTNSGIDPVVESPGRISEDVLKQYYLTRLK